MHSISIRKNQKKRGVHNEYDVEMEMVLTPLCGAKIMNLFDKSKYFCIFFPKITKIGYFALLLLYGKFISRVGNAKRIT